MRIKIMSDSTCDLSRALIEENDIYIVPLTVVKDDKQFQDGLTITPAEIFAHVAAGGALCSTSAVSVGEYEDYFEQYAAAYDGVLLINLGSGFSSCYQNALVAAEDYPNVRCIDSENLSAAQGLVVLKACELAQTALSIDDLAEAVKACIPKVEGSFVLDQLKFLVKGGRCSSAAALGANLLNLKPCIELKDGKLTVGKKYRGSYAKSLVNYIKDRLAGREDLDTHTLMLVYTVDQSQETLDAVRSAIAEYSNFTSVVESYAGCTISSHCGPGTLGIMFLKK
mgnify:CR=1 FL=1